MSDGTASDSPAGTEPPANPPPPIAPTGGYATHFNLVRPYRGRYLGGVCAAIGRATNTDPVLWRVILPVLMLFNGLGALLYLLGVLLIPSEGDSGSPVEALAGHGESRMQRGMTISLIILASITGVLAVTHIGGALLIGGAVVAGVALLAAARGGSTQPWPSTWPSIQRAENGFSVNWPTSAQATPPQPGSTMPTPSVPTPSVPTPSVPTPSATAQDLTETPEPTATPEPMATAEPTAMAGYDWLDAEPPTDPGTQPVGTSVPPEMYQEPFAPFGPYASGSAYPTQFPGLAPTSVVTAPPQPRAHPHSPIRRITVSAAILVVGFLGIIDAVGVRSVPVPMYFAAALATIGIGMFVGSFFGRVRGPITLGVLLVIGLMATATFDALPRPYTTQSVRIAPTSVAAVASSYDQHYGTFTLDLTHVPFTAADRTDIAINMKFGHVKVLLPPNTYAAVTAHADAGEVNVADQGRGGINARVTTVVNQDSAGKTGALSIHISITAGDVEVNE